MAEPRVYGRYLLDERIAMGGMAEIFRARTRTEGFEKVVCIKRVLPHFLENEDFVRMFRDEAHVAAKLQHGNVVQMFDFGEVEGTLYLAMEFVDGADLRQLLDLAKKRNVPFGIGQALHIGAEICRGLQHAHQLTDNGTHLALVHRDVSPHNVLLSKAGEVKLTDFGIAKAAERATHTSTGVIKGKLSYMAPEQAEAGVIDHRVDQFATGIVIWEMLTGKRLFSGANEATILRKVLTCEVPPPEYVNPRVPKVASDAVMRALSMMPDDRYQDMRAFERALTRAAFTLSDDADFTNVRLLVEALLKTAPPDNRRTALIDSGAHPLSPVASHPPLPSSDEASSVFTTSDKVARSPVVRVSDSADPNAETVYVDDGSADSAAMTMYVEDDDDDATLLAEDAAMPTADDTAPTRTVVPEALLAGVPAARPVHDTRTITDPSASADAPVPSAAGPVPPDAEGDAPAALITFPHKEGGGDFSSTERVPRASADLYDAPPPRRNAAMLAGIALLFVLVAGAAVYFITGRDAERNALDAPVLAAADDADGTEPIKPAPAADDSVPVAAKGDAPEAGEARTDRADPTALPVETAATPTGANTAEDAPGAKTAHAAPAPRSRSKSKARRTRSKRSAPAPAGEGRVAVQVQGSWAYVNLGKKRLGEAPGVFKLPAGKHRLVLKNPELNKTLKRTVVIKDGETTRLRVTF